MRRTALLLAAGLTVAGLAPSAQASLYCADLGPVPGYGPVCAVRCALGTQVHVDPKNIKGTSVEFPMCPA